MFCGCVAILAFLSNDYIYGIILVLVSAIFDFLDGFVARLLDVQSDLGKQLDSLADMISFGFVPGIILFLALKGPLNSNNEYISETINQSYLPLFGFIITVFSGLRLAKFNIDSRQSLSFLGLPTPANTLFFLTLPLIWINENPEDWTYNLTFNKPILIGLIILFSYLLISEIPLLSLKFKGFRVKENLYRYILFILSLIAVLILKHLSIPTILIIYVIISLFENIQNRDKIICK